jgi:class 3 adenylate cyclase/tetratricopeptide (TPR) repeat protein
VADILNCPTCSAENAYGQSFCTTCGSTLGSACLACGVTNASGARFCGSCGTTLEPATGTDQVEERKIVSVLFVDLVDFTARSDRADPEDVSAALRPYHARVRREIEALGGTLEKFIGDAAVGLFGAPIARDDDAVRAVRAGLKVMQGIEDLNLADPSLRLAARAAVNTGEVVVALDAHAERGEGLVTGDVMNTASRMQGVAPVGSVVVGELTFRATSGRFEYEELPPATVKGKAEPLRLWKAGSLAAEREPMSRAPFVGRSRELDLVTTLWLKANADRDPHMVTVIGLPGIGKSRLLRELQATFEQGGSFLKGRCRPYGETTGYGAFGQQVMQIASIFETDAAAVAHRKLRERVVELVGPRDADDVTTHLAVLLGLSQEGSPDKQPLFYSARRFVERVAAERPTVLAFEDIHWAETALLELIASLASRVRDVPLFLVTLARPELLDRHTTWGGGLPRYTAVPLQPLEEEDARVLAATLVSGSDNGDAHIEELVASGGGNPLFLEELAASLNERAPGVVAGMPMTVQSIIAARLDGLPGNERRILQDAAVMGRSFWRGALVAISGEDMVPGLDEALDSLVSRDLIRRQPTSLVPEDEEYLFKHILIREVAYSTLARGPRRTKHAAAGRFIEEVSGGRVRESASILAHHFREAGDHGKAAEFLMMAAEVASRAWAKDQAITLYGEAIEMLEAMDDPRVVAGRLGRALTYIDAGRYAVPIDDDLAWLLDNAEGYDLCLAHLARARSAYWLADAAKVSTHSEAAVRLARELGDEELEGRALAALCDATAMPGRLAEAKDVWTEASARWPVDRRDASYARHCATRAIMSYWTGDYDETLRLAKESHELGIAFSNLEASVAGASHVGLALVGLSRYEEGIEWFEQAIAIGREWEQQFRFTARAMNMKSNALREIGDVESALTLTEEALELAEEAQFLPAIASARLDLLDAHMMQGWFGDAQTAIPGLMETVSAIGGYHQWLFAGRLTDGRARAALALGDSQEAATLASTALSIALEPGRRKYAVRARITLARALLQLGLPEDALAPATAAVDGAEELQQLPSLWPALALLSEIMDRLGRQREADDTTARALAAVDAFAGRLTVPRRAAFLGQPDVAAIAARG